MLKIDTRHRLTGEQVAWQPTPNIGGALAARFLVMHYTAGGSAQSAITTLTTKKPQGNASAHLVLARDGAITQLAPFNVITWHAGVSQWDGIVGLNRASIGIELDNAGPLNVVGNKFIAWFGREYPASDVMLATHRHGGPERPWHAYTEVQIERCLELAEVLVQRYRLTGILGHDDIARGRKLDPGPAFPLGSVAARALGRADDAPAIYVVTSETLNIRAGPDASFPHAAAPLPRGTRVLLIEPGSRWSKVEVVGPTDLEGWVNNRFIGRVKAMRQRAAPKKKTVRKTTRSRAR
jgi:N-acetylmuramoyl-L-alanine amidase